MAEDIGNDDLGIKLGEVTYSDEVSEFVWTKGSEVINIYAQEAKHPATIQNALFLRAKTRLLKIRGYSDKVIRKLKDWRAASISEIDNAVRETFNEDPFWGKEVDDQSKILEKVSGMIEKGDMSNVQLAIIKKRGEDKESDYTYLVVYPPNQENGLREREASFPTALCHVINAKALLRSPRPVEESGVFYDVSINTAAPISDEDLVKIVTEVGRTPLDMIVQGGLKVIDKVRGTLGQHIDPISSWTNKDYAVQYALATHRGVGSVSNEKIVLPPLKS